MDGKVKETLEKQLELLSERSKNCISESELRELTAAMVNIVYLLVKVVKE